MRTPKRLKDLLTQKGMTQSELSKLTGITPYLLSELISGKRKSTTIITANKICRVVGVTLDYLFGDVI